MFTRYFGLKENPFALSPDPRYLYLSQRHQDALAHLLYGINGGGGFVQLTGEVGTGKTMMIRVLLQRLPETVDVALVLYPFLSVRDFLLALCGDLRIPHAKDGTLKALIDALNGFLLDNHAKGRRTVLIVDEAHRLNREVLEQIRLLTNLETTREKLLQIVLVGQPELDTLLAQPDMRQLAQRITARYDLRALLPRDTRAYVLHRCRVAGAAVALFSPFALWQVHRLTGGVPRLVNILCDRALLGAYARGRAQVSSGIARAAAREVEAGRRSGAPRRRLAAGVLVLAAVAALGIWRFAPDVLRRDTRLTNSPPVSADTVPAAAPAAEAGASGPGKEAGVQPPAPAVPAVAQAAPALAEILADPEIPTDTDTAFTLLFAQWNLDYAKFDGGSGCERATQAGLQCLFESGTWNNLRQLNRPAIIELADAGGTRHHVLAAHLDNDRVTLVFPSRRFEVPLNELDRLWFGKYLALWSLPEVGERTIRRGMRGLPVAWVRDVLARYGLPRASAPASDVFDADLEEQVREFQRRHQLQNDGIVGKMTIVYLSTYDTNSTSPQLASVPAATR